ncbi:MAG: DUF3047 domain-containing protein [Balneolaceae bacterium]
MKLKYIKGLGLLLAFFTFQNTLVAQKSPRELSIFMIEDFENEEVGNLPANWYNQRGERRPIEFRGDLRKSYSYEVKQEEDGNKYLQFDGMKGKHLNYPLINKDNIDLSKTPILNWRWRIHTTPIGGNEEDDDTNDVAASIYVVFDLGRVLFKKVPKTIRYTWSSSLPVGTELSKFFGNQKIIVMGTGDSKKGEWQSFERNIVEDYKRLYGDTPPNVPIALLILSDGISTGSHAKADYDDIFLKSE